MYSLMGKHNFSSSMSCILNSWSDGLIPTALPLAVHIEPGPEQADGKVFEIEAVGNGIVLFWGCG
jgi:hypothetical protein